MFSKASTTGDNSRSLQEVITATGLASGLETAASAKEFDPGSRTPQQEHVALTLAECPHCRGLEFCVMWGSLRGWQGHLGPALGLGTKLYYTVSVCPWLRMAELEQHLGKRFAGRRFETFRPGPGTQEAYERARAYAAAYVPGQTHDGLFLCGPAGTGKTHLAASVLREVVLRRGEHAFAWCNMPEAGEDLTEYAEQRFRFLVLDDLTGTAIERGWRGSAIRRALYVLVNRRYERELPTITTCNMVPEEAQKQLGADLVGRLVEMSREGRPVILSGSSWRGM